jgi:hypothetical protein
VPSPGPLASGLVLALLLLSGGAPRAAAEGDPPGPPAPKAEPEAEEVYPSLVSLEPFDRKVPAGAEVRIKFRLKAGLRTPVLVVIFPDGAAAYVRPDVTRGNEYEIPFRLDHLGGTHRLTLMGFDGSGERVTAKLLVRAVLKDGQEVDRDVEIPSADTKYADLDPEENPLRLERWFFHRMNGLRRRQGLAALPWHEGVARSARVMLAEAARHWEETYDPRLGCGLLLHRIPGAGPGGTEGPSLADRVHADLLWTTVLPYLPPAPPDRGKGNKNYVSESLAAADASLDREFEQEFLRKSALRAPMVSDRLTHAAGAATWRNYGPKGAPGTPPKGQARQAFGALVFIQVNDPAADGSYERERTEVRSLLSAASSAEEKAGAWRRLGQAALPESPKVLEGAAGKAKDPVALAGALDGLWLCDPGTARRLTEPLRLRALQALEDREEAGGAEALRTLAGIRYDAASRRAGESGLAEVSARARRILDEAGIAAKGGKPEEARALLLDAKRRFAGYPEEGEVRAALRLIGGGDAPPPK